ncbi:MAG: phosphoribosylanthranilate isomerase [Anaerolineae bacterium]
MKVKICGITNLEDARAAIEAGADMLGFVFYPTSPRYVEPETAATIIDALITDHTSRIPHPASRIPAQFVGVFVDEQVSRVREILDLCHLHLVQLHGSEPPAEVRMLQPWAYKALRPRQRGDAEAAVATYAPVTGTSPNRPAFLIDAYHPWQFGGTGETTDWIAAKVVAWRYPILLAGGLIPENVADAIRLVEPWGVDVSSGVEAEPGKKDHRKVQAFIEAAKSVDVRRDL